MAAENIAGALGTARQFSPQPRQVGQGQYRGVQAVSFSPDIDKGAMELATNIDKLEAAMSSYKMGREKIMNEQGLDDAQSMINSLSAEDIKKLNVIDAAQQEGLVDSMDNPYFKAYSEKLRGDFLSTAMRDEYDSKYGMTPAKSAEDEQARFSQFSKEYKDKVMSSEGAPIDTTAFNKGYFENSLVQQTQVAQGWYKRDHEAAMSVTMSSTQSKLGNLISNSVEILKEPGAMTKAAQDIFNEPRLMGLPASTRIQMLDSWTQQFVQTGHIDADRLEQMLGNLVITANPDGSETTAAELVNMQSLKTQAANYRSQYMTKQKYDFMQNYIDKKDKVGAIEAVQQMIKDNPDEAPQFGALLPHIMSGVDSKIQAEQRQREAAAAKASKNAQQDVKLRGALKAWVNGDTVSGGNIAAAISGVPQEMQQGLFLESVQYAMNSGDMQPSTRMDYIQKIMQFPPFGEFRKALGQTYATDIRNIVARDDGSVYSSGTAQMLLAMRQASPQNFAATFGDELDASVGTIMGLIDNHGGDMEAGLRDFAKYNTLDNNTKETYSRDVKSVLANTWYTIGGVHSLGGGDTASPMYNASPELSQRITEQAQVYMAGGASAWDAVNMAGEQVRKGYMYYHGAMLPKGILNNIGTVDNERYAKEALDRHIYILADKAGLNAEEVDVRYSNREQQFYISGGGQQAVVSLERLRSGAYDIYAEEANAPSRDNNVDWTLEETNKYRTGYSGDSPTSMPWEQHAYKGGSPW